ncbi:MAG: (Dimethylallyl)adenosine tRNA methylthiotransferase MiaB [Candidatus Peregrinibacteria bacterium GW2011_GWA2_33_10]|nr:MAG: (Dimethylallyl)adenosine tRNA methylthiotransferase MiaB [Candidatus Peregrinibacteria bacterium GW2011_GWA2_33_10]KKP38777.1 MAG: (dimethylallyl)adenosine tRNA methylthiotransferase MiaB, bifunctional enzyme involved in thiolation and methylation of tRNA [Candidatus Peregrinibacteria bacterium GW2011_GWC2_33_13]OGJ49203.1 MAG: tRNA (N6-isopentenyl adenosine(37)-C2)-methylthiotransferase MiaB [Candidatus Peregrinibacteria bacterium RIFOXYA2_FULL_33_7]
MSTFHIETLGCQMNHSDSERIKTVLENLSYKKAKTQKSADLVIFNTCSVRQKAEDRIFGLMKNLKKIKNRKPDFLIGLTGCMVRKTSNRNSVEQDKLLKKISHLDFVFRIEELPFLPRILMELNPKITIGNQVNDELQNYFSIYPAYSSKFQAFVPIMTGCDKFCTYCVVPYSRGRERSRNLDDIINEINSLAEKGCIEITLLGQTVDSYGQSIFDKHSKKFAHIKGSPFAYLLKKINDIKKIKRLRFSSPHPQDMSDEVIELHKSLPILCPYIHLPVQSGDNQILKRMNRTYTREHYLELIHKLRKARPDIAISTDLIVGFPGETDEQFQNTYNLFHEVEFDHAYISQYSPRKETFSAKHFADDVPAAVKKQRWDAINKLLKQISFKKHQAFENKKVEVLAEKCQDGYLEGRSEHFKTVRFEGPKNLIGTFQKVHIDKALEWLMEGKLNNS